MPPYKIIKKNGNKIIFYGTNRWLKIRSGKRKPHIRLTGMEDLRLHDFLPIPQELESEGFLEFDGIKSDPKAMEGVVIKYGKDDHGNDRAKAFTFFRQ